MTDTDENKDTATGEGQPTPAPQTAEELASEHSTNLPELFEQLGISLLVTTYQAGKLIAVRNDAGKLNTHFRQFSRPMGMAATPDRFVIGCTNELMEYRNVPAVCAKLEPKDKHDACFIPRSGWVTGDIDIHEMDFDEKGNLWFINTRFSTLCTLNGDHSFVPRWRPKFVSSLAPEDRCHLNGLGMLNGQPRYVTALARADKPQGWREHKKDGGVLIDIETGKILCRDLSMPHSPRWYAGQLWVLESGKGALVKVDYATGERETLVTLPGFTRGLAFYGPLAFIGLSQVRESATFSGIPITEQETERNSGVWVVNIQSGQIVGILRFKAGVQEIFAVSVLPGVKFPEILEPGNALIGSSYVLPDEALKEVRYTPQPEAAAQGAAQAQSEG